MKTWLAVLAAYAVWTLSVDCGYAAFHSAQLQESRTALAAATGAAHAAAWPRHSVEAGLASFTGEHAREIDTNY
jgi:hypothetical protein